MKSSLTPVGIFWAILSLVSSSLTSLGFYLPYWLRGLLPHRHAAAVHTYFGLFRRCNYLAASPNGGAVLVEECGRYASFEDIPSVWWQIGTVVAGVGCVLSFLVACAALVCCCSTDMTTRNIAIGAAMLQAVCGACIAIGCLLLPLGWSGYEVQQACGKHSGRYHLGDCSLSWAYYATMAGGLATFICALIACFSAKYKGGYQSIALPAVA